VPVGIFVVVAQSQRYISAKVSEEINRKPPPKNTIQLSAPYADPERHILHIVTDRQTAIADHTAHSRRIC